ncbi:hypothetical protein FVE85_1130 [Porphyridium purpureum]|uniref:Uncharacterized protein n=1 Tax=Porphyridium purpureum TaxID=35688 RepID=A0A5J4Z0K5_PORPP|nr:hypothetical protein FVE85_1130 [Porphyridium purpureum]|eukprot:POR2645..scf208_2
MLLSVHLIRVSDEPLEPIVNSCYGTVITVPYLFISAVLDPPRRSAASRHFSAIRAIYRIPVHRLTG